MIYAKSFIDLLRDRLGDPIDIGDKNIKCRCPNCELDIVKSHYHLYISLEIPAFNCFHCGIHGGIKKLINIIDPNESHKEFVNYSEVIKLSKNKISDLVKDKKNVSFNIPELNYENFKNKQFYLKKRLKFYFDDFKNIPGLIFDFNKFIYINNIQLDDTTLKLKDFIQSNFICFLTRNHNILICRNIDPKSSFKFYKVKLNPSYYLDYYSLNGYSPESTDIILGEGMFDILVENIFDSLKLRNKVRLYACGLSKSYSSILKSIIYDEGFYKANIHIISDSDVKIEFYKNIRKEIYFLVNSMKVYYNKSGKDFGEAVDVSESFMI